MYTVNRIIRKVNHPVAVLLLVVSSAMCQSHVQDRQEQRRPLPPDENPQFFPTGSFGSDRGAAARVYSWCLRSMEEKPLSALVDTEYPEVYRLIVELRPYNSPVVVRLKLRSIGDAELVVKVGRTSAHPDIMTVNKTSEVPRADAIKFTKLLQDAKFWSEPFDQPPSPRGFSVGGESWMLEAMRGRDYHAVLRPAPDLGTLKDPAEFLVIRLAGIDLRSLPVGPEGDK